MATIILKAVEIITDDGRGIPVAGPISQVGLAADGHIVLITGRPNIVSVTGDTTRTDWVNGILAKDANAYLPGEHADFVEAGCFSELGDFEFAVKNTQAYIETCEANGVYLSHRTIIYYHVTSADGSAFNFERRGTYVIEEIPFNKLVTTFKCINNALSIFNSTPNKVVDSATFPKAPADSRDKPIPIVMGRVPFSPLVNVSGNGDTTGLTSDGTSTYDVCTAMAYDKPNRTLTLLTGGRPDFLTPGSTGQPGVIFNANDTRLVNKYLSVLVGKSQRVRIYANDASAATPFSFGLNTFYFWVTTLYLAEELDETGGAFVRYLDTLANVNATAWFFQALDLANTLLASCNPVSEIAPLLAQWNTDQNAFRDVSEILNQTSASNIDYSGHPGASTQVNRAEDGNGFANYQAIVPKKIVVSSTLNWATSDLPAAGSEAPLLIDRSDGSYYSMVPSSGAAEITLDIYPPDGVSAKSYSEFELLYDYSGLSTGTDQGVQLYASVYVEDVYGAFQTFINAVKVEDYAAINGVVGNVYGLPRKYVNSSGADSHFFAIKGKMDLQGLFSDSKKGIKYKRIRLLLSFRVLYPSQFALKLMEIGFVGKTVVDTSTERLYTHINGEMCGTTWDGRFTADYPLPLLPMAIEHLIRDFDTPYPVWRAGSYIVGSKVRGTVDTGHIFVCTAGGITGGSEPSWTDTAGATYTDGGVTWKEWKEIPIDTASFTTSYFARLQWFYGWTLDTVKPTFDWVKEACEKGMLIGMVDRYGRVKIKPWRELSTPLYAFTYGPGGNILEGTFEDMPMSDIARIYNDILIKYDWNYAAGKFNQQLFITKIDEPAFPGPFETVGVGTDLGAFTITHQDMGDGTFLLTINTTLAHGLTGGEYIDLQGNTDGYSFPLTQVIAAADSGVVNYIKVLVTGGAFSASISSSGTLKKYTNARLKWKDYVGGLRNYARAKELWDKAHLSYTVTGVVQKLPDKLGECKMFIDPYAKFNGKYIWSDDGGTTPLLDVGDDHPAVFYADALLEWNPWPKKMPTFEVADEPGVSPYTIGDCVSVLHPKLTQGVAKTGWIFDRTELPRDDANKLPERFRFGVMLKPDLAPTSNQILESGSWPDTITESGSQPDTYTEGT